MSYTKREWATGNVVGAVDLNRMEQGIEDAGSSGSGEVLVVNSVYNESDNSYTLNKTWQEIYDAFPFVIEYTNENGAENKNIIHQVGNNNGIYFVSSIDSYETTSASGYPTSLSDSGGGTFA